MTLKITRFLTDAMNKQAKISHFGHKVQVGAPEKLIGKMKGSIAEQFGELFLNDANYLIMTSAAEDEPGFDRLRAKFAELIAAVLDTDVAKNEVKVLKQEVQEPEPQADGEDNIEQDVQAGKVTMLVKVTTK